ncbi:MAG: murein biosynthesis integral membrane protein MurJ, partial [Proteobacteria bacterium]|nr:murein biosynthesis integral membrane protein MurJ [Pseudomonadota bacterium]
AIVTTLCVILTLPLIYVLMKKMGLQGVASGLSLSVILQAFVLFECWNKKSLNTEKTKVYLFFFKMIPISLVMGIILYFSAFGLRQIIDQTTHLGAFAICCLIGLEFLFVFFLTGTVFKIKEILSLYENIFKRLFPWMKKSL